MEHFGLESLDDLPGVDELEAAGLLESAGPQAGETGETLVEDPPDDEEGFAPDAAAGPEEDAPDPASTTVVPLSGRSGPP